MKIFKKAMLVIISLLLVLVLAVIIFFYTAPQIGKEATGDRLARMRKAENFANGKFSNTVETNMDMPFSTLRKVMREYFFGDKSKKQPSTIVQTKSFKADQLTSYNSDTIAFSWFGHSSIILRMGGLTILTDPVLVGERASMFPFMGPKRFKYDSYVDIDELPEIDLVLISHDHYDHLDYPTISAMSSGKSMFYAPLGVGAHLEHWGISASQIKEFEWWQEAEFGPLKFAFAPTRHFSGRALRDRFNTLWGSWAIIGENKRLYYSGDSGYFPGFKEIGEKYGPFDLTFMECGAYNEGWSEIHMFPEETAQAHLDVKGKLLMPIHWGKFDLSLHDWTESVERLTKKAEQENITLVTPEIGEMVLLPDSLVSSSWWEKYN